MKIVTITKSKLKSILPLIAGYQEFYKVIPSDIKNLAHFRKYTISHKHGIMFGAYQNDKPVGFCTLYFVPTSFGDGTYCLLNDLYTLPETRNLGIGKALIEHAQTYTKKRGIKSMEWWTQEQNTTAQRVYDKLNTKKSSWFLYELSTQ